MQYRKVTPSNRPDKHGRRRLLYGMTSGLSARAFISGQADVMRSTGWDVGLLCSEDGGVRQLADEEGIQFYPVDLERSPSLVSDIKAFGKLWSQLTLARPDLVVWGSPKASLFGTFACRLRGIPNIYIVHGLRLEGSSGIARRVLALFERLTCRLADVVIADGYELREKCIDGRLVKASRIHVVAHGSANGVPADKAEPRYRQELSLPSDAPVVVFAGRITKDKGIRELSESWQVLYKKYPEAHLLVAGRPDDTDPHGEEFRQLLSDIPRCHLLGHIPDVDRLFADADILVLPSYREGLPLVVIEAAASGVPAVITDCTGGRECVLDGVTGYVVPVADTGALTDAVARLLTDPNLRKAMGAAAQERALARYDRTTLWQSLADFFHTVVTQRQSGRSRCWPPFRRRRAPRT